MQSQGTDLQPNARRSCRRRLTACAVGTISKQAGLSVPESEVINQQSELVAWYDVDPGIRKSMLVQEGISIAVRIIV
jgi:hypothetical protein